MDGLPTYSSSNISPPSYEASIHAAQQEQESIWPRNYRRETPRIDVVKFYHDLILTCPQQQDFDLKETKFNYNEDEEGLPPLSPSTSLLSLLELDDGVDDRSIVELNQLLLQTWPKQDDIPSYEVFKAKANKNQSLRPISNTLFRSS